MVSAVALLWFVDHQYIFLRDRETEGDTHTQTQLYIFRNWKSARNPNQPTQQWQHTSGTRLSIHVILLQFTLYGEQMDAYPHYFFFPFLRCAVDQVYLHHYPLFNCRCSSFQAQGSADSRCFFLRSLLNPCMNLYLPRHECPSSTTASVSARWRSTQEIIADRLGDRRA